MNLWFLNGQFYDILLGYLPSLIVLKVFHLGIFILFIAFSQQQPLKSRGLIPFLAYLRFFISSFFAFIHFGKIEYYELGCYFSYFIEIPLTFASFFLFPLTLLRYIIIANLNWRKQNISKSKKTNPNAFLILLKYSIHPIVTLAIWFFLILIFLSIDLGLVFGLRCETNLQNSTQYISIGFYVIIIGACAILFIIDIVSNLKRIFSKCGICKLFWKYDAYYFRSELYIFGLGVSATLYVAVTMFQTIYLDQPYLLILLAGFFLDSSVFFFQSGFVLLMTILQFFIRCFRKKPKGFLIEKLLENSEFHDLFKEFAKSEWSTENLSCYDDLIEFEKSPSIEKLNPMMELYFNGAISELEVNVQGALLVAVKEKINRGEITNNMFEEIKSVVVSNLLDTQSRFIWTSDYKQFIFRNDAFGENLEK
jgi:hypothetical protein